MPIREGTPVLERPAVPLAMRTGLEIGLVEDLRIGTDDSEFGRTFNIPRDIVVDEQGRIYASDGADKRVLVFDSEGRYLRTMGTQGGGPGGYDWPTALALVDGRLVVSDEHTRTITVWSLEGEPLSEHRFDFGGQVFPMYGVAGNAVIGGFLLWESPRRTAIARISVLGKEKLRIASLRRWPPLGISHRIDAKNSMSAHLPVGIAQSWFVAAANGDIYLTSGDEYQVLSLGPSGESRWALRVPWERERVTQEEIDHAVNLYRDRFPAETLAKVEWPEIRPALAGQPKYRQNDRPLQLDGHGHLYVFPYFPMAWRRGDRLRPVDVYTRDGELLFAGMIPNREWVTAQGDHVYGFEEDVDGNVVLVRHRLVEPF